MSLASALAAGYATQRADGSIAAGTGASQEHTPTAEEPTPDELQGEAFKDAEAEQALEALVSNTSPGDQVSVVQELIDGGEVTEATLNRAASQAGVEPGQLSEQIGQVREAMLSQASAVVSKFGLDPQTVFNWAHEADPKAIKSAMTSLAMNRTATAFGPIAEAYIAAMDRHSPDAILNAQFDNGVTAKRDASGVIVLTTKDGQTLTWSSAVRSGLVKLSSAK